MWREDAKAGGVRGSLLTVGGGGLEVAGLLIVKPRTKPLCEGSLVAIAVEVQLKANSCDPRDLRSNANCLHHHVHVPGAVWLHLLVR